MKDELYLILPNIRSAHNVGSMFRTSDAFGVTKLFLVGYTATPPKPQIDKVSLGAEKWMSWEQRDNLEELILELKKDGVKIVGLEKTESSEEIEGLKLEAGEPVALIVGNEVDGISSEILELCDLVTHIPMFGKKESLNVSVAAGIALHVIKNKKLDKK